jgi:hypothetical protein
VEAVDNVWGTSDELCCFETIWLLVQPVGNDRVYPHGSCNLRGEGWSCPTTPFGHQADEPGQQYWVTAVIIIGGDKENPGAEESTYEAVVKSGAGYDHYRPPVTPTRVSNTITVTRA